MLCGYVYHNQYWKTMDILWLCISLPILEDNGCSVALYITAHIGKQWTFCGYVSFSVLHCCWNLSKTICADLVRWTVILYVCQFGRVLSIKHLLVKINWNIFDKTKMWLQYLWSSVRVDELDSFENVITKSVMDNYRLPTIKYSLESHESCHVRLAVFTMVLSSDITTVHCAAWLNEKSVWEVVVWTLIKYNIKP